MKFKIAVRILEVLTIFLLCLYMHVSIDKMLIIYFIGAVHGMLETMINLWEEL